MRFDDLNQKEYEILERLGGNALYGTYMARQVNLGRYVTIRALVAAGEHAPQRFANELSALAMLNHPNNRRVIDAGAAAIDEAGAGPYLVFDYLYGDPLTTLLDRAERLETAEVLRIARQLLGALAEAHRCGVLHRQLAPSALMLCQHHGAADHLMLIDYALEQALDPAAWIETVRDTPQIADFAAPELLAGAPPTIRSDLFSAAAVLYRCAVGVAFSATADTDLELQPVSNDRLVGLQGDLIAAIDVGLHPDPEQRYTTAHDFLDALAPLFDRAHDAAVLPASMSTFTQRAVMNARAEPTEVAASLTEEPSIWVLTGDPALDFEMVCSLQRQAAHYQIAQLDPDDAAAWAAAMADGEVRQPWLVVFGDIHVIMHNPLLATLRDLTITQRILVSARLNAPMLEAAVNFCGVDQHLVRPVNDRALSDTIETLMADCRRQLQRQEALRHVPDLQPGQLKRRQSLTGMFAAETR